jgi:cytochrome c oxidase subunit 4
MSAQVTPKKTYFAIFGALMLGTVLTILAARVDLGALNTPVALLIAGTKATLVVWFFMEVRHAPALTRIAVTAGVFGLAILLILTYSDYASRNWLPNPPGW